MKIKGFKIFALSMAFMLISASSAYADNYNKNCSTTKTYKTLKKSESGNKRNGPKEKGQKVKDYKIKGPKTQNPKKTGQAVKKPVKEVRVAEITLNKTKTTLAAGSWERLSAYVKPANTVNKHVFWFSTMPDIATVNQSGKVTGIKSGKAVIYAVSRYDFNKMDSCIVTVKQENPIPPAGETGIYLNKTAASISVGSSETIKATMVPANSSDSVTWWSGNSKIVTVNQSGLITGKSTGTTQIFAMTSNGRYVTSCKVTVVSAKTSVTSVSINKTTSYIALKPDSQRYLTATVEPASATNKSLTWSSEDTSVAVVDQSGKVTAKSKGTSVITVTTADGRKTDRLQIKVIPESEWVAVTQVKLNLLQTSIPLGEKDTLKYSLVPSNASNQEVIWTSSNTNVATVTNAGVIEAKNTGTAVVTVTSADGNKKASCIISVVQPMEKPANGILFNKITSTLLVDMSEYPTVKVYPSGTTVSSLSWSTSDSSIATVSKSGKVTAKAPGTAVITAKTSDNKTATYLVVVTQ